MVLKRLPKVSKCFLITLIKCLKLSCLWPAKNSTDQAGMPTQSSSQATMVGPFQRAKGVPAFIASSSSSCFFFFRRSKSPLPASPPIPAMLSDCKRVNSRKAETKLWIWIMVGNVQVGSKIVKTKWENDSPLPF